MQIKNAYKTLIKCILQLYQVHLSSQPREISTTPKQKWRKNNEIISPTK